MAESTRRWRIADQAGLAWRQWDDEYVFHHALSNDTHRLTGTAGSVLCRLLEDGETEEGALAEACGLHEGDLDIILTALAKIDFVAWR
jgi:hypothetical protein